MPHLQYRRVSCRSWAPLMGDGDDIITELINGFAQTCFSGRAKGNNPSPEKPRGFEPRTEPELSTMYLVICFPIIIHLLKLVPANNSDLKVYSSKGMNSSIGMCIELTA